MMQIPDFLTKMLNEIALKEGFTEHKLELEAGSSHGDNYMGVMISVILIGDRVKNGVVGNETLNLICKMAPESKERREISQAALAFEREIYMYTRVLPTFIKFQEEKGLAADESFLSFPKVYAWTADEVNETYAIVMEDLRSKDFAMWPRHDPIDFCHEKLLFTHLGRFHGISFAMKDQRPEIFAEFKKLDDLFITLFERGNVDAVIEEIMDRAITAMRNDMHKQILQEIRKNYLQLLKESFTTEATERFGVINHGDCWINNFLFQYDENSKAVKNICFLDWQISRYASPAVDVLYQIFSSTRKELRDRHYTDLLCVYYTALSETVCKLGSDPEKLFRYSDLMDQLKLHGKFALFMGVMLIPIVLAKPDEVRDMDDLTERLAKGEKLGMFTNNGKDSDVYIKVMNDLVSDIIAYGYNH